MDGPMVPPPAESNAGEEEDRRLIDAVAGRVVRMGLAVPAIFFLESTKPLSFVGSQMLVFLEPFVKSFLTVASYDRFVALLEDRRNIETLLRRIEDLDEEERQRTRQEKQRAREARIREKEQRSAPGTAPGAGGERVAPSRWRRRTGRGGSGRPKTGE